jgi:hypothetical protein
MATIVGGRLAAVACALMICAGAVGKDATTQTPVKHWEVTPTSLVARGEPALQNVALSIETRTSLDACTLKVFAGDRLLAEKPLGALTSGTNRVSVLLPEPSAAFETRWVLCKGDAVLAEQAVTWKPPRHWTIYEVLSSHVDIGLHNPQYMQRRMGDEYLDMAQALLDQSSHEPDASRFRYVVEGFWWWKNYELDRSERAAKTLIEKYARPGLIGIGASHSGNRTETYGTEELCRSAYYARELRYRWGLAADAMLMVDNNGITWPLVQAYADAGIRFLGFYPNPWNPDAVNCWSPGGTPGSRIDVGWDSPLPHLFYWQGPDGKSRLLVWSNLSYGNLSSFSFGHNKSDPKAIAPIMARQLALVEKRYPYDVWMVPYYNDNQAPGLGAANRAKAWNAVWRWPELRTTGDLSVPFKQVEERFGPQIPTLSGLMTAGWAQHPVCTPSLLADKFEADRLLPTAEKLATLARLIDPDYLYPALALRRAWDALVSNDEHGYGTSYYKGRPVYDTWMQKRDWIAQASKTAAEESGRALRAIASKVETDAPALFVFNPTLQARRETVEAQLPEACAGLGSVRCPDGTTAPAVVEGRTLRFRTSEIPPLGYALFTLARGTAPSVTLRPAAEPPVLENAFYRLTFDGDGGITGIYDKQLQRELVDARAPYRCNQLVYSKDRNKTFVSPRRARFEIETSALGETVIARFDDPNTLAEIIQRVSLPAHEKRIDIDNRLNHVRDLGNEKRWDRFGYYAFPFAVPRGEFRVGLNGCHANAYRDQTGLTTDTYHAARDWAYVGNGQFGIALVQRDSQLIECGKIHAPKRTFGEAPETSHLYSYAMTDWLYEHAYETGPSHIHLRFRYSIRSHAGAFCQACVPQFAERTVTPLLASVIPHAQRGTLSATKHSFLRVDSGNVELLTLKLSEEPGRGLIARFHETDGERVEGAAFHADLGKACRLTRCSVLERECGELDRPSLALAPFGTFTLRFEAEGSLPAAPSVSVARVTDAAIELNWAAVPGVRQYHVFRGEDADFAADEYHLVAVTREPAWCDAERSAGETRYYRVAAVNDAARQGAVSAAVAGTALASGDSPPAKVGASYTGLISAPRAWRGDAADRLYLQWGQNREKDLSHYELFRGDAPDFEVGDKTLVAKVQPGPYVTVPYEDQGLKPHTVYYYRVRAVDRDGHAGEPSDVCTGVTREPPTGQGSSE